MNFLASTYQSEFLPADATEVHAVTAGNHEAFCVYPPASATGEPPSLVRAGAMTRAEAASIACQLQPEDGTAIGTWLDLARDVFVGHPEAIKLAYMLTDGRNESEPHENLDAALRWGTDAFQCDAWGVGSDEMALDISSTRTVRVTAKPPDLSTPPPTPPAPPTGA